MSGDRKVSIQKDRTAPVAIFSAYTASILFLFNLFCLSGCSRTEKSAFYTLFPLTRFSNTALNTDIPNVSVGIGPIIIPEYLNRPQIVTRSSPYEVDISEFNRWADTLDNSVSRVLAENLSTLLSTDLVYTYPWRQKSLDYQVRIEIIQFDAGISGNIELMTRWSLFKDGAGTRISNRKYYDRKPIAGQGYSGMVEAMSLVLNDMSKEIAEAIIQESLSKRPADRE